jgi:hypothetical protein
VERISKAVGSRWQSLDRLLPAPADLEQDGCGAQLRVLGSDGELVAAGSCRHWEVEPGSLELTWGTATRFELTCLVAGHTAAAVRDGLDRLLPLWRDHLRDLDSPPGDDSAAVVNWPSRDIGGVEPLVRRGFAPLAAVAARAAGASALAAPEDRAPEEHASRAGIRVRRALPADLSALVELGLEAIRFDAHFGGVRERQSTSAALAKEFEEMLCDPQPWIWLAERGEQPIGMLAAEKPQQAAWIAPMTGSSSAAYVLLAGVAAGGRAHGVGAALTACLNVETRAAGVPVTLLHYAQVNPLSAPFWSQQGYRPLWTCWEARPPASLR